VHYTNIEFEDDLSVNKISSASVCVWVTKRLPQYSVPKKSRTYHIHDESEIEYFFVTVKDKRCCRICNASVSLPRKRITMLPAAIIMTLIFHPKEKFVNLGSKNLNRNQLINNS
jgi:hypothetical protein